MHVAVSDGLTGCKWPNLVPPLPSSPGASRHMFPTKHSIGSPPCVRLTLFGSLQRSRFEHKAEAKQGMPQGSLLQQTAPLRGATLLAGFVTYTPNGAKEASQELRPRQFCHHRALISICTFCCYCYQ